MEPIIDRNKPVSDKKLEKVVGGAVGAGDTESPAAAICGHCGAPVSRSGVGLLGYAIYDCSSGCGWRTKYKGNEQVACYDPHSLVLDGCP